MSIENYITRECETNGLNVHVTCSLDIQGYADEVANDVDEQLFHAVAIRRGYVPERTCSRVFDGNITICSDCCAPLTSPVARFCQSCGAKVVEP